EINGLAGHPYASARSPTVTFDNENKSTPWICTSIRPPSRCGTVARFGSIRTGSNCAGAAGTP
ncbi:hypothetical protein, partial [Polaromonas aquatica]